METILKCSDFASALGINKGLISIAKKKGHLVSTSDGKYDYENKQNAFWIKRQIANGYIWDLNRISANKFSVKEPSVKRIVVAKEKRVEQTEEAKVEKQKRKEERDEKFDEIADLQEQKLKAEIKKLHNSDRLETLRIAKLEGELLPVDVVEHLFIWSVENMKKTYEQEMESVANLFIGILGGEQRHFVEIKKKLLEKNADIGMTFRDNLLNGLENQIAEYQEVRSRGERKL